MNSRPTILVSKNRTVFQTPFLEEIWKQYFNVQILDVNKHYDKRSTIIVSDWVDFCKQQNVNERILANKGIRYVIDHCWDSWDSSLDNSADFTLRPRDFIRINESMWYKHLGYNKFNLTSDPERDFLLLMHGKRPHRTKLYNALKKVLPDNIYSYVGNGISLQNAQDQERTYIPLPRLPHGRKRKLNERSSTPNRSWRKRCVSQVSKEEQRWNWQ